MMTINQCLAHMQAYPKKIRAILTVESGLPREVVGKLFDWNVRAQICPASIPTRIEVSRARIESWLLAGWNVTEIASELRLHYLIVRQILREMEIADVSGHGRRQWRISTGLRWCERCGQIKNSATEFADRLSGPEGKSRFCLDCDPAGPVIPREKIESLIQAGFSFLHIQTTLRTSNPRLHRLLREYGLTVTGIVEECREREARGLRRCCQCKQIKSLETEFGKCRSGRLGKNFRCHECNRLCLTRLKNETAERRQADTGPKPSRASRQRPDARICNCCRQRKLLAEFDFDPKGPRHRSISCLECMAKARQRASARQSREDLAAIGLQLCLRCHEVKNLEQDFYVSRREASGRCRICRPCTVACQTGRKDPAPLPEPAHPAAARH